MNIVKCIASIGLSFIGFFAAAVFLGWINNLGYERALKDVKIFGFEKTVQRASQDSYKLNELL